MKEKARAAVYSAAGIYLLVMAHGLWKGLPESSGNEHLLMAVFAAAFLLAGAGMIAFGAHMMHSFYKKPR